jgi:pyridoxamine 5'-phosphate oxidase
MTDIAHLRKNYMLAGLTEKDAGRDPIALLQRWLSEAIHASPTDWYEPNVMTLATATTEGIPSARIVLLKGLDERGPVFYTNYESQKGIELAANPHASLVFHWQPLERQVRLDGVIEKTSREESEAYFVSRPRGSQLGAWASRQSAVIEGREPLEEALARLEKQYAGKPIPLPPFWGGYRLKPHAIEFWQGRPNRLHDRIRFVAQDKGSKWHVERLSP